MKTLLTFLALLTIIPSYTDNGNYAIITVVKESNNDLHPYEEYFWIIDINEWSDANEPKIVPLYLDGFTQTDFTECKNDTLILFNQSKNEAVFLEDFQIESINDLKKIIEENRRKIIKVKKKWLEGRKQTLEIFITPVNGKFLFCNSKRQDGRDLSFNEIAMPINDFSFNKNFWDSDVHTQLINYDYSNLPFISLLKLRDVSIK